MTQSAYGLSAKQNMAVSPRLQQAVRLLQMSATELQLEIQQQLASNPFLEENETGDELAAEFVAAEIAVAGAENETVSGASDAEATVFDRGESQVPEHAPEHGLEIEVQGLDAGDWNEVPTPGFETMPRGVGGDPDTDPYNWISAETGLREHLRQQVCGVRLGERERLAAVLVIETLEDDGYLREDVSETVAGLALDEPFSAEEIAAGIRVVQQLDPAGVGARDLSECLGLQLRALSAETPSRALALLLVGGHLELLAKRDYGALQHRLDCSEPALKQAHALIRSLNPRPGEGFTAPRTDYVVPDVIVALHKGKLAALINPAVMPRARLNRGCIDLLRRARDSKYPAMQQQLQEARWLLRNVEQRYLTIRRVADAIVTRQRAFFQYGEIALKPLMLREVADELGLHESTLSRATSNKYMATPRGIFEFKHFFSRQLSTDTGGTCSATAVRALIQEMIEQENRDAPLSDVVLAKKLSEHGICVARRTVAKYRNQLKISPWESRYQS